MEEQGSSVVMHSCLNNNANQSPLVYREIWIAFIWINYNKDIDYETILTNYQNQFSNSFGRI